MQRTTKIMLEHYMARALALDVVWMQQRRSHIIHGGFDYAMVKGYNLYTGNPLAMIDNNLDYPSPLFDRARKQQCRSQ